MSKEGWDRGHWVVGGSTFTSAHDGTTGKSPLNRPDTENILLEAVKLTDGPRQQEYGVPFSNLSRIANLWRIQFGWDTSPEKVAQAMILLKMARLSHRTSRDSYVDIAGYARLAWDSSCSPCPLRHSDDTGEEVPG